MIAAQKLSPSFSERYCRFCGISKNVTVDIFETGLAAKAAQLISLPIDPKEPLPRLICERCQASLVASYQFMTNAITREIKLRRMYSLTPPDCSSSVIDLTEHPNTIKHSQRRVDVALEKLKSSTAIEIKKVVKKIEHGLPQLKIVALPKPKSGPIEAQPEPPELPELDMAIEKLGSPSVEVPQAEDELPEFDYASCTFPPSEKAERTEVEIDDIDKIFDVNRKYPRYSFEEYEIIGTPTYICQQCSRKFRSRAELQTHFVTKKGCRDNYPCPTCGKVFNLSHQLKSHQKTHLPKPEVRYTCEKCDFIARSTFDLDNHRGDIHGEQIGFAYRCCDKKFTTLRELQEHEATHEKLPLLCATCGKSYRSKQALAHHEYTHSDARPYECKVCGQTYKRRENLIRHGQQHTGIKLFHCDLCPKEFAKKDSIINHYRKFHSDQPMPKWSQTGEKLALNGKRKREEPLDQEPTETVIEEQVLTFDGEMEVLDEYLDLEHSYFRK